MELLAPDLRYVGQRFAEFVRITRFRASLPKIKNKSWEPVVKERVKEDSRISSNKIL